MPERPAGDGRPPCARRRRGPRPARHRPVAVHQAERLPVVRADADVEPGDAPGERRSGTARHTSSPTTSPVSTPCSSTGSAPAASMRAPQRGGGRSGSGRSGRTAASLPQARARGRRSARPSGAGANAAARRARRPASHSVRTWRASSPPCDCWSAQASAPPRPSPGSSSSRIHASPGAHERGAAAGTAGACRRDRRVVPHQGLELERPQRARSLDAATWPVGSWRSACARRSGAGSARPGRRSPPASACR